jgi:hypothetical protein
VGRLVRSMGFAAVCMFQGTRELCCLIMPLHLLFVLSALPRPFSSLRSPRCMDVQESYVSRQNSSYHKSRSWNPLTKSSPAGLYNFERLVPQP